MPRHARDADPCAELREFLKYQLDDGAFEKADQLMKMIGGTSSTVEDTPEIVAQDHALAFDHATSNPGRIVRDRDVAIRLCQPHVPHADLLAQDSAEGVLRAALKALGHPRAATVHRDALPEVWNATKRARTGGGMALTAQDGRNAARFMHAHPEVSRIRVL